MKTLSPYRLNGIAFRKWGFAFICAAIFALYCAYVVLTMRTAADTIAIHVQGAFALPAVIFGFLNLIFNLPFSDIVFLLLFVTIGFGMGRVTTIIWPSKLLRILLVVTLMLNSGIMVGLIIRAYTRFSYF